MASTGPQKNSADQLPEENTSGLQKSPAGWFIASQFHKGKDNHSAAATPPVVEGATAASATPEKKKKRFWLL